MKRKTEIVLIIFILILAGIWRYIFWAQGVYGTDVYYHYTITEQALQNGKLSNDNNLALCYEGVKNGHPLGFYVLPYWFGKSIGLDNAFILLPILLGILSMLLAYIFVRHVFNTRVALVMLFFTAISVAHISKSFPFSWRGENLVYPLIFISLFALYKSCIEKKRIFAMIAGVSSGISSWFWNGYPLVIVIFILSIIFYSFYLYYKKEDRLRKFIEFASLSLLVQAIVVYLIFFLAEVWGKGYIFAKDYYWIIIVALLIGLTALYLGYIKRTHRYLILYLLGGILVSVIYFKKILILIGGFGSVNAISIAITPELAKTQGYQYFFAFYILLATSIAGLYSFFKRFDAKRAFFLGLLLPALYLLVTASRYVYFAAIPFITLTALWLDNKKMIKKKFDIFIFLTVTIMMLMFIYSIYAVPLYYSENLRIQNEDPYIFLREKTEKNACIIELSDRGATIEYFAKRYYYFHSLGADSKRVEKAARLLLRGETNFNIENFYILTNYADFQKINLLNTYVGLPDIGFYRFATAGNENSTVNETEIREELGFMKSIFVNNNLLINNTGRGCAYVTSADIFYLKDGVCNTTIFKMITNQTIKDFENVYFENGYSIYKYKPTSSLAKKE